MPHLTGGGICLLIIFSENYRLFISLQKKSNVVSFRTRRENFEKNFDRNLKKFTKWNQNIYEKKAERMHQNVTRNVTKLIVFQR